MTDQAPPESTPYNAAASRESRLGQAFGSAMIWNIANNLVTNGITLVVFVFLTYRLDPVVFGIFALGVIIADYFTIQGRSACIDAAVQRRAYGRIEMDSIFWSTLAVILVVIVVSVFVGRWLADANGLPDLAVVMPALGVTLLALPLSISPNAIMLRDYDFRGGAIRGILSAAIGGIAALVVVFGPAPEWALVAQRGAQLLTSAVVMALRVRWMPGFSFSGTYALSYLQDAGRIFAGQALGSSQMRVLDLVMAFSFGAAAVGFMRIASRFVDIIYGTFIAPISSLWVVVLSEHGSSKGDRDLVYRRLSQMTAFIVLPIFGGLAVTSGDAVKVTLSDEYAPTATMLMLLCAAGLLAPLTYFRNAAMIAVKRLNLLLAFSAVDIVVVAVAAFAMSQHSANAVVASLLVLEAVRFGLTVPLLLKDMETRAGALFMAVLPAYMATAVMAGAVWLLGTQLAGAEAWLALLLKAISGAAAYFAYLFAFHREWTMAAVRMLRPSGRAAMRPSDTASAAA